MKIAVCIDGDGNFRAVNAKDRDEMWDLITNVVGDGDMWANRDNEDEYPDDLEYMDLDNEEWMDFITSFESRGTYEILDVKQKRNLD